jgi:hypothetical protein
MKFYITPPTVNNPDLTPLLNVEGPIEVYDVWEVFREDIIKFLEDLPNEVTYHTADGNLKNDKLKIVYEPYSFLTEISQRSRDIYYDHPDLHGPIKYNFISLCSAPQEYKYDLLDRFHTNKYFIYSNYPYSKVNATDYKWHPDTPLIEYKGKNGFSNLDIVKLTEIEFDHRGFQELIPLEYYQTNCDLVLESTIDTLFITEKTWKPIVFKKPFLVWGSQGLHAKLKDLGFELYDELFDYSFDGGVFDPNWRRLGRLCESIKPYMQMEPDTFKKKIKTVKDKIEFNYKHYCELFDVETRNRVRR